MLDVLIPHIVSSSTILQNFEKTKCANELHSSFGELTRCSQNMSCGQCEVLKCLTYRHILKSIVKKPDEKNQKIQFFWNLNKL